MVHYRYLLYRDILYINMWMSMRIFCDWSHGGYMHKHALHWHLMFLLLIFEESFKPPVSREI